MLGFRSACGNSNLTSIIVQRSTTGSSHVHQSVVNVKGRHDLNFQLRISHASVDSVCGRENFVQASHVRWDFAEQRSLHLLLPLHLPCSVQLRHSEELLTLSVYAGLFWCFHNPLNSDKDYRIFNVCMWSCCMRMHTRGTTSVYSLNWRSSVGSAQNLTPEKNYLRASAKPSTLRHPSIWWPRSIVLNLVFESECSSADSPCKPTWNNSPYLTFRSRWAGLAVRYALGFKTHVGTWLWAMRVWGFPRSLPLRSWALFGLLCPCHRVVVVLTVVWWERRNSNVHNET